MENTFWQFQLLKKNSIKINKILANSAYAAIYKTCQNFGVILKISHFFLHFFEKKENCKIIFWVRMSFDSHYKEFLTRNKRIKFDVSRQIFRNENILFQNRSNSVHKISTYIFFLQKFCSLWKCLSCPLLLSAIYFPKILFQSGIRFWFLGSEFRSFFTFFFGGGGEIGRR